jgi:hypothetical protein
MVALLAFALVCGAAAPLPPDLQDACIAWMQRTDSKPVFRHRSNDWYCDHCDKVLNDYCDKKEEEHKQCKARGGLVCLNLNFDCAFRVFGCLGRILPNFK